MPEVTPFGRWLKRLRADRDLTQEALAEEVGCAIGTIRSFETGKRRPSREMADRLAAILGVPAEQCQDFGRAARMAAGAAPEAAPAGQAPPAGAGQETAAQFAGVPTAQPGSAPEVSGPALAVEQAPLVTTKLYMPRPRTELVSRTRLLARLNAGLARPVTLLAAAAGFGKTTLLADWLTRGDKAADGVAETAVHGARVAWLALDAGDSDPSVFLRYLIAALQTIEPRIGGTALSLLRGAQAPPLDALLPMLVGDLTLLPERTILVLDDYHVVDSLAVHRALQFLVEHLPPQLHLVIATRVDPPLPLARLRARGQLSELRAADLRFTLDEAATFFRQVMDVPLRVEDVAALQGRTEGWIAGLQLAGLAMQHRGDLAGFVQAFAGSNRFVVDYLAEEVIERLPAHLHTFVLQTSILDRLCGPLCDAVLGVEQGPGLPAYSQLVLAELERANLFLIPLDDERHWYRYHHLFGEVVRTGLRQGGAPDQVAELHRRASVWFEQQGIVVEAVQHALAGHDWERAARLIGQHAQLLLARGQVQTVLNWLNTLPAGLAQARPFLDVIHAGALLLMNQLERAERHLQAAERSLSADTQDDRSRAILGTTILTSAYIAFFRGDLAQWLTLSRQALAFLSPTDVIGRPSASLHLASDFLISGDVTLPNEHRLVAAVAAVRQASHLVGLCRGIISLAELQRRQGRLRQASTTYGEVVQALPDPVMLQALSSGAAYYFGLGDLLREWNDLVAAEPLLLQGRSMVQGALVAEAHSIIAGYSALAQLQQVRGDHRAAQATLAELAAVVHQRNFDGHLIARVAAARAHLAVLQGDVASAVQWADASGLGLDDAISYPHEREYMTLARVRIAQGRSARAGRELRDVQLLLDRLLQAAEAGMRIDSVIPILILRALLLDARDEREQALAALDRALTLAAPEGYVRVFLDEGAPMAALLAEGLATRSWGLAKTLGGWSARDYARQLLAASDWPSDAARAIHHTALRSPTPTPPSPEPGVEALTNRELDVLRLLAVGRSNQAIADELVVAVGTVKRHLNSIFSKLDVQSRLEAVARARELGLG